VLVLEQIIHLHQQDYLQLVLEVVGVAQDSLYLAGLAGLADFPQVVAEAAAQLKPEQLLAQAEMEPLAWQSSRPIFNTWIPTQSSALRAAGWSTKSFGTETFLNGSHRRGPSPNR
jgi:hypothetical protein